MLSLHVLAALQPYLLAGQPSGGTGGLLNLVIPFALVIAVFYFLLWRPQKKREQEHQDMVENLKKGDQIVTIGGIHGTIRRVDDDSVLAQVDSNGVKLRIDKQAIANVGPDDE